MSNGAGQSATIEVVTTCIFCGKQVKIVAPVEAWKAWDGGRGDHIQDALPMLSADEREVLISQVCGTCFDAACGDEDDDDDEEEYEGDRYPGWGNEGAL